MFIGFLWFICKQYVLVNVAETTDKTEERIDLTRRDTVIFPTAQGFTSNIPQPEPEPEEDEEEGMAIKSKLTEIFS